MAPDQIANYRLINRIASGGMGTVYLAVHELTGRHVALKVMAARGEMDDEFVSRFRREGQAIVQMDHPHIVKVYEAGCADGLLFLAMEYLNYGTLKDRLAKFKAQGERMPIHEALMIAHQIGEALQHAHLKGLVHRDVKPSNIMLAGGGRWVLTDFGVACAMEGTRLTRDGGQLMGTPEYMAPERVQVAMEAEAKPTDVMTRGYDHRSDLYSLGIVLYEMLTGITPFTGDTELVILFAQIYRDPAPIQRLRPEVSRDVVGIIERTLAKDPQQRFQNSNDLVNCLEAAIAAHANITTSPTTDSQLIHRAIRLMGLWGRRRLVLVAALCCLLFIGFSLIWLRQSGSTPAHHSGHTGLFEIASVAFISDGVIGVYSGPDSHSHELARLAKGAQVKVFARSDDDRWLYISETTLNIRGWVRTDEGTVTHKLDYVPRLPMRLTTSSSYDSQK